MVIGVTFARLSILSSIRSSTLPLRLPSYFISDLSKNPKTKFSANIFPSKILQQRSPLFVCVAKKKRGQGINHRSSRIFLTWRGCETEGGAGSSTRLLSYSRIRRRGTKLSRGAGREGETLNAKLAIVSARDKSATRLFSRTFVSGIVVAVVWKWSNARRRTARQGIRQRTRYPDVGAN